MTEHDDAEYLDRQILEIISIGRIGIRKCGMCDNNGRRPDHRACGHSGLGPPSRGEIREEIIRLDARELPRILRLPSVRSHVVAAMDELLASIGSNERGADWYDHMLTSAKITARKASR